MHLHQEHHALYYFWVQKQLVTHLFLRVESWKWRVKNQELSWLTSGRRCSINFGTKCGAWRNFKQGKIPWKYVTHETPVCVVRWQNWNQQWSYETRTLTLSRGIQKKEYTDKGWMMEPCEMIHNPWKSTPGSVDDTTSQWTGHESRGYHMSNWPLLSCL